MKNILAVVAILMIVAEGASSQNVNWKALDEGQRNIAQFDFGYDYGVTAQLGYSRSFDFIRPVVLGLDYSFPMGNNLFDDFKVRLGGQVELIETGGFSATVKILSNFRRYENEFVKIASFGSDFALVAGYYTPSSYLAGEIGFDKSITSNLKHSAIMRSFFPTIRDGWYIPSGGHYYYGLQGGAGIGGGLGLSLRLGATKAQANDEDSMLPYYFRLGLGVKF